MQGCTTYVQPSQGYVYLAKDNNDLDFRRIHITISFFFKSRPARAWFLKIDIVRTSVCVSAPRAIKNYSREMKSE